MAPHFEMSSGAVLRFRGGGRTKEHNRFTDAEMEAARNVDLPELLASLGYQVKRIGNYHTTKEMDSLRIRNRRTWFRYSENVGGDAITFLQHFCGKSFPEAVECLLQFQGQARDSPIVLPPAKQKEKTPFSLPPAHSDQRRVFAYLRKRGTYDLGGNPFKGDVEGGDKDVAFRLPCDQANPSVLVFEAPIDLMSYCTLHRKVRSNAVALCGLYQGPLDTYLREHPHLKSIILCLDADRWGREAAARLTELYSQKGYHVMTRAPPRGKDWNEFLQEKAKNRERAR